MTTQEERAAQSDDVIARLRLDGIEPTPQILKWADDYVEGRSTIDDIAAEHLANYRRIMRRIRRQRR